MVTIKDVAEKAGVSLATVSRVLNGHPSVRPETRRIVMEWIEKLGYQPNFVARGLSTKKSHLIGVIIREIANPFFAEIVQAIEEVAAQNGYSILLCNTNGNLQRERNSINVLLSRQAEGLLLVPASEKEAYLKSLLARGANVAVVTLPSEWFDWVAVNHREGGRIVAKHLIGLGHTDFAFIGKEEDEKFQGFREELEKAGLRFKHENLLKAKGYGELTSHEAYKRLKEYLERYSYPRFSAIFAYNDLAAFGAMQALEEVGIKVGRDIALVGFDNTFLSRAMKPSLTSVAQPTSEIGRIGVELLLKRIRGSFEDHPTGISLQPRLVVRESTLGISLKGGD